MIRGMLYPDESPQVFRRSSIDQYKGFFAVEKKGGWAPVIFDQLDGINCETIYAHPVVISFVDDIGYHFSDAECSYASDHFVYFDKDGVEESLLPECMGGGGESYVKFIEEYSFVNFDLNSSLGSHNENRLRVGMSYVLADKTLPADD